MKFTPSTFTFIEDQFGELILQKSIFWLDSSFILTKDEVMILALMIESKDGVLLYRATRDGFKASSFHSKCDGKAKTITIIKTKANYVFGGYTAASWDSNSGFKTDADAYIYSLRRNGVSILSKHPISRSNGAIFTDPLYGPHFGAVNGLHICNKSDVNKENYTNFKIETDSGMPSDTYLAGTSNNWLTDEIEVFQIL